MRRASSSIGRFLPAVAMTNTAAFFQSFRFNSAIGTENYRNELAEFVKTPHQEWKSKGLDPVRFVRAFSERKFYQEDQKLLIKLLHSHCLFVMNSEMNHPGLSKIAHTYALTALIRIADHSIYNDTSIHCSFKNDSTYDRYLALEEKLRDLEIKADEILALLPAEKKEGLAFDMFKTLRELFHYVRNMGPELRKNGSAPDAEFSPRPF